MRPRDITDCFHLPIPLSGISRDIITSNDSKDIHQTSSPVDGDFKGLYRDLDYAGARFRRTRDHFLDNFRVNFRRLEDAFNDWNNECLELSYLVLHSNDTKAKRSKVALQKKIKDALEGLKEIEEIGKKANTKFRTVVSELTMKSGSRY